MKNKLTHRDGEASGCSGDLRDSRLKTGTGVRVKDDDDDDKVDSLSSVGIKAKIQWANASMDKYERPPTAQADSNSVKSNWIRKKIAATFYCFCSHRVTKFGHEVKK